MHIRDILTRDRTTFSFEFFPPKTDAASEELFRTIAHLQELKPSFVSVTYGAGGGDRDRTHNLIVRIQTQTDITAVSHLTCVCHSEAELAAIDLREEVLSDKGDEDRRQDDECAGGEHDGAAMVMPLPESTVVSIDTPSPSP